MEKCLLYKYTYASLKYEWISIRFLGYRANHIQHMALIVPGWNTVWLVPGSTLSKTSMFHSFQTLENWQNVLFHKWHCIAWQSFILQGWIVANQCSGKKSEKELLLMYVNMSPTNSNEGTRDYNIYGPRLIAPSVYTSLRMHTLHTRITQYFSHLRVRIFLSFHCILRRIFRFSRGIHDWTVHRSLCVNR